MKTPAIIVLLFAAVSLSVHGAADSTTAASNATAPAPALQITNQDLKTDYEVVIQSQSLAPSPTGTTLGFLVTVVSRSGTFPSSFEGKLEVYDADGRVLTCDLQTRADGQNLSYAFDLSSKYLPRSRFTFSCVGKDAKGEPTSETISAMLADFVKSK